MEANDPSGHESVGEQSSVHLVCHECPHLEDLVDSSTEAHDIAVDHLDEHENHTVSFKRVEQ